jgi:MFS family permease
VAAVFFVNGASFANWVARVPAVKDRIDAGTGTLGVALLGIAAGSLVSMPFAGRLCERYGSRTVVVGSGLMVAAGVSSLALAPSAAALGGLLAVYGAAFGLLDVSMNVQAVAVVRRVGRPIMPWFHAAFSLGGLAGAVTGGLAAGFDLSIAAHFALVTLAVAAVALLVRPYLLPDRVAAPAAVPAVASHGRRPGRRLTRGIRLPRIPLVVVGLGGIAGCSALAEGAMADWTALFLRDVRGLAAGTAALGYAAFSITMTVGRLGGEAAIRRLGPVQVLRIGGLTAAFGVLLAVVVASPAAAFVGFGLVGVGVCCAFPLALTTAGESSPGSGGSEIATVSVIGYLGFLIGPPVLGLLAEVVELRGALLVVAVAGLGLAALASVLDRVPRPEPDPVRDLLPEPVC